MAAQPIPADTMVGALLDAGVQDVILVPDTHQRSVIARLRTTPGIRLIPTATEDEAVAVGAGLIVGGRRPLLQIQHAGLYACVNTLRGVAIDGRFPLVFLVGLLGREPSRSPREDAGSMVRLVQPLLEAMGVPHHLLDGPEHVIRIPEAFEEAESRGGPVALLVGAETSDGATQ